MKTTLLCGAAAGALTLLAGPAFALEPSATAASAGATVEELVVFGQNQARQVQVISGAEMALEVPGASPLKLVDRLPSVNIQAADPFGSYEWAARITIRGFNQGQLGFTLDDVPLGDMTYGNHNGLHISRAIASENVGSAELAQGAGSLGTPSSSNLGGVLNYTSRTPSDKFEVLGALTGGSDNTVRGFVRVDSGELASGLKGYLSYSNNSADKWKGQGEQKHEQVNLKLVQPIGEGSLTGWLNWSKRRENDYQDLSLDMVRRLGPEWDNITGQWARAVQIAEIGNNRGDTGVPPRFPAFGAVYPAPIASIDDAYYDAAGVRDDWIGAVTLDLPVNEAVDVKATVYGHTDKGQGLWWTPYVASPNYGVPGATTNDAPISIRTTEYNLERYGVVAGATWRLGAHTINAGVWYEDNSFVQARRYYALNRAAPQRDGLDFQSGPFRTDWEYDFTTTTWQFHVQDSWKVTDALTFNFGFKSLSVENEARTVLGADKSGKIKAEETFLPQAGVVYDLTGSSQLFASYARNMRAFPSSGTSGPFSASRAGFLAIKDKLQPEIADNFELGWRFQHDGFRSVVAVYHVKFKDRLFAVPVGSGIIGNPSALSNVGGVTSNGFEAAIDWRFLPNWTAYGSYAYNSSKFDDDTFDGNRVLVARTNGKVTPDTPENLFKFEVGYDDGSLFARGSLSHLSRRYFTYENDQSVGPQTVMDLTAGYRFQGEGLLGGLEVQATITNLLDEEYLSTINSNGFVIRGDSQTLLAAPPRQAFVTVRKTF
jgi:iron complex outermembrane recepter protein